MIEETNKLAWYDVKTVAWGIGSAAGCILAATVLTVGWPLAVLGIAVGLFCGFKSWMTQNEKLSSLSTSAAEQVVTKLGRSAIEPSIELPTKITPQKTPETEKGNSSLFR